MSGFPRPKRFWSTALVAPAPDGFAVSLDARPLKTPAKRPVVLPTAALAAAVAAEWDALEGTVDPGHLPLTRLANSAIDGVAPELAAVRAHVVAYGGSDLLCYRADTPEALLRRQASAWDPWLAWARDELGAALIATTGVMPVAQPPAALDRLAAAVADHGAFGLAALHDLVTISGSLVLGLAVAQGALAPAEAFALSTLDETWQAEQWGRDAEAEAAAERRRATLLDAARFLSLLNG